MALALGVLLVAPALPSRAIILPLALSALLYGLAYGVVSVSSELRYYLWTMIGAALAAVMAVSDMAAVRERLMARHYWMIAGPPLAITAICTIWRLTPGG
jgi:hydrogenase/urease accessory protein HupE